jgi:hypothetical protein
MRALPLAGWKGTLHRAGTWAAYGNLPDAVKDTGSMAGLEPLAQLLEHYVPNECGDEGDYEVGGSEDVVESEGHAFAVGVGGSELAHQQIGIEQEDNENDLNYGP